MKNKSMRSRLRKCIAFLIVLIPVALQAGQVQGMANQRDPFLEKMMQSLQKRKPTEAELERLSQFIKQHPNNADAHVLLAEAYMQLGMDGLYAEEMEKAWQLAADALIYLLAAMKARVIANDRAGYERLIERAYAAYSNDSKSLRTLSIFFYSNKEEKISFRFLEKAYLVNPDDLSLRVDYCSALMASGRFKEVLETTKALAKDERTAELASLFDAVAYSKLNQYEKAIKLLSALYKEKQGDPLIAEAYFDALSGSGNGAKALEPAMVALALQALFVQNLDRLKIKIKSALKQASALEIAACASRVDELLHGGRPLAFFYFALADLLDENSRIPEAINYYAKGLEQDSSLGVAYMRLGRDLEIMGAPPETVMSFYKTAAAGTPDDPEVSARYLRMKARMPAMSKDFALKLKHLFNQFRYRS